ncbi:MAG: NAD-dependent epimerase/dehydratase family protein [Hyphomicrobiaceae bacterium]
MTLLVTGASGHVGQEIVRQATERGLDVVAVSRGGRPSEELTSSLGKVVWIPCDLADAEAVAALARDHRITTCIHGAAVSNEAYARPDPLAAITTNVSATANLLEAARLGDWRRFLLISTGSVFQCRKDAVSPILEDEPPAPKNIYSTTKVSAEMLVRLYRTEFDLSAASVRISWVYGPPVIADAPTRGPIPSYLLRSLRGEAIDEPGGDFAASFTFVGDVAAGLLTAADVDRLSSDIYHLGPGRNYNVRDVADAVMAAVPDARIALGPGTEPWTRFTALRGPLAGNRLLSDTGFAPKHSLNQGIAAYADWMRDNRARWS